MRSTPNTTRTRPARAPDPAAAISEIFDALHPWEFVVNLLTAGEAGAPPEVLAQGTGMVVHYIEAKLRHLELTGPIVVPAGPDTERGRALSQKGAELASGLRDLVELRNPCLRPSEQQGQQRAPDDRRRHIDAVTAATPCQVV